MKICQSQCKYGVESRTSIKLSRIIPELAVIMDLEAEDYSSAILEIVRKLAHSNLLEDADLCGADVLKRESSFTTCLPGGIALPHARTAGVSHLVSAIALSRNGVLNADGCSRTNIFILTLSPVDARQPYLQYISRIGELLLQEKNIDSILNARTPEELRNIFINGN